MSRGRLLAGAVLTLAACTTTAPPDAGRAVPGRDGALKTAATVRAGRRAYDGAPPVIPHQEFDSDCLSCHTPLGMAVDGVGFAPAMPHGTTAGLGNRARCRQCHVLATTAELRVASRFVGLRQDLRAGERAHPLAPPVLPHPVFMHENCRACHTGPGAREEIRTSHPERPRCRQCHAEQTTTGAPVLAVAASR